MVPDATFGKIVHHGRSHGQLNTLKDSRSLFIATLATFCVRAHWLWGRSRPNTDPESTGHGAKIGKIM